MKARIEGEDGEYVKIHVTDNNSTEHNLTLEIESGEIVYHEQDGYADDASKRTDNENYTVREARRYAQYYVHHETKYDTLPWDLQTNRFETVREALSQLSTEEAEEHFGNLLRQSLSHYESDSSVDTGDIARPIELPKSMSTHENAVLYCQELYLDEDGRIETVSGIHVNYYVAKGERRTDRHGNAPDREPDARIEIQPVPIVDVDVLCEYLQYNLRCQIRDCYICVGLEPPEEYRVLGPGQDRFTRRYHAADRFPEYYDKHADIPGYNYEFTPSSPVPLSELTDAMAENDENSLYGRVRDKLFTRNG
ncbi:hypothetical protein C482_05271 [Natrialba chahannaoensis JCM 10990]|uniref:Uncharacterized protein n=1 Tax=Natrialba chahannaoensis JCM 10990 TaxID=1227492 RepID=M0AVB7_9EURY|nr:hypothetical protein [Natrialba chahannaoensis]ELZ02262.1 hypothetical protein C482_05271 [Natrialba chahannaoensis JCM 10990]